MQVRSRQICKKKKEALTLDKKNTKEEKRKSTKRKKHDKIEMFTKNKPNTIKILISKALIDLIINHDELILVNNMLREYDEIGEENKILRNAVEYTI